MTTVSFDRSRGWNRPVHSHAGTVRTVENLIDLEFSEVGRSARMPAGWFVLPSAIFGGLLLFAVLHGF